MSSTARPTRSPCEVLRPWRPAAAQAAVEWRLIAGRDLHLLEHAEARRGGLRQEERRARDPGRIPGPHLAARMGTYQPADGQRETLGVGFRPLPQTTQPCGVRARDHWRVRLPQVGRPAIAGPGAAVALPAVIVDAGPAAVERFLEFFAAAVANARTRAAYARAAGQFLAWCAARGLALRQIAPLHVAAYIRTHPGSAPTVKQHLAAIRALGDWLVVHQVLPVNPAAAVRGPKHVVTKGATPVLTPAETRSLLDRIDPGAAGGLRDRALLSVLVYSFARVSAAVGMRRQDYFRQGLRGWLRLHEKGGKRHDVPGPPPGRAGRGGVRQRRRHRRPEGALVSERRPDRPADGAAAGAPRRPGDDQAPGGGRGAAGVDLLPHVSGDGDHGVSVERRDARARAADRRARIAADDEALRPDSGHDHRRRDRAHRDLASRPSAMDGNGGVKLKMTKERLDKALREIWRTRGVATVAVVCGLRLSTR